MTQPLEELEQLQKHLARLERKLAREKNARLAAEALLEEKSRELYHALKAAEQSKEKMSQLARTDPLTRLANRRELTRQHEQFCSLNAREPKAQLGLLMIDLNGFKPINDQFGHDAGDTVLTTLAQRLSNVVRGSDCLARVGGDEFAVLCGQIDTHDHLEKLAMRIASTICEPIKIQAGRQTICSASIGSAVGDADTTLYELMRQADDQMYKAKRAHKSALSAAN